MAKSKEPAANQPGDQPQVRAAPVVRVGESNRTWFRSGRVFTENEQYFVATREGIDVGPFESEEEAQSNAERLIQLLAPTEDPIKALIVIREFNDRPRR